MLRRVLFAVGVCGIALTGAAQLASDVRADPPLDHCAAVLCLPCPEGTVASPVPGNCCRCIKPR